ncbi:MAG: hypothetical protein JO362_14390 [Streptomycetaceae bacterium]|nr:hypothetical protein [Streptomycetaceae bacterium]
MGSFWDTLGGRLADRWLSVCGTALIFEAGGVLVWARSHGGLHALEARADRFAAHPASGQLLAVALVVIVTAAVGLVVERTTLPALRLLEGYWPDFCAPLRDRLAKRFEDREAALWNRFEEIADAVHDGSADSGQRAEYAHLTHTARRLPGPGRHLPTRVGNILRAAEARPYDRYGLDTVSIWPHLWLLLPETTRQELTASRAALDRAVAAVVWGTAFLGFGVWTPWALLPGAAVAILAGALWVPARAGIYADMVSAAFDLHRELLYAQLRWPLPQNPAQERTMGARLSTYLVRGLSDSTPTFTP